MGCCGQREKGAVSEQQKWDYIVCDKTGHYDAGRKIQAAGISTISSNEIDVVMFSAVPLAGPPENKRERC